MHSSSNETVHISKYVLGIAAIILFGVFMRLFALDYMALHHDESIHSWYTYKLYKGNVGEYKYDPTYHGPFLYHYGALFFTLFGDTDFTARLPYVSFGILLLYFVWRMKPYLGKSGTLVALLLVATSPTLTYFARFARNDVYMGTMAMGILVFGLDYLRTKKHIYLGWMTFFLALMYCCKENSYMTGFVLGSFVVFYGIYYFFSYPAGTRKRPLQEIFVDRAPFVKILILYAIFSCVAFTLVYYVTQTELFKTTALERKLSLNSASFEIGVLKYAWNHFIAENGWVIRLWVVGGISALAGSFALSAFIRRLATSEPFSFQKFARKNTIVLVCVLIALLLYTFLFTTMGYNQAGMKDGVIDYLLYWMGQQENPRIADHPSYFIPRIILYEPVSVVFGLLGFVFYMIFALSWAAMVSFFLFFFASLFFYWNCILTNHVPMGMGVIVWGIAVLLAIVNVIFWNYFFAQKSSEIQDDNTNPYEAQANETWRPDGVRIFLIYWSVLSILIYAGLNEKVPWLMVHQVLPLVLLAGVFIGDLIDKMNSRALRYTVIVFVSIFVVYEARTNIILNFYNPDDPRESIVYTQSSHQVKEIAAIVDEGARLLGREYLPPNPSKQIVAMHSEGTWPLYWYFRRYYPTGVAFTDTLPPKNIPYVITDTPLENRMKVWGEGKYIKRRFPFRINWPYGQAVLPFAYFTQRNEPQSKAWEALWDYIMYRELWGNLAVGGKDMLFYRRKPLIDPEQSPAVPKGYDQPVRPLLPLGTVGGFGTGEGQFNEPRGVILSPDGSLLYVLDGRNARIQVFDKNLKYLSQFGGPGLGKGQFKIDQYGGPNGGMAIGPDGKLYVTDTWADGGGRINVYTAEGQPLDPILSPPGDSFYYPRGVAVDSRGLIYVADTGKHRVVQYNPDGSFKTILGANAFTEPVGITAAHDGKIYICDVGGQRVVAFTPQGTFFRQWQILGWNPGDMALSSICPYVDVDRQGNIYVTDATTNTIHKISQGGDQVVQAGSAGNTRLNGPKGIVVDQNNNLFIADSLNNRIIKARIP